MSRKILTAFIIAVLVSLPVTLVRTADYEGVRIDKVLFEGAESSRKELLKNTVFLKSGDLYRQDRVADSIKELYKLGYFSFVSADIAKDKDSKIALTFKVAEFPELKTVKYEGMKKVSSSDIEEQVKKALPEGATFSPSGVKQIELLILSKYREEGMLDASVAVREERSPKDNSVTVTFVVDEGPKTVVKSVHLDGCKIFSERKLLAKMDTKAKDWLHAGVYDPDKYQMDLEKLTDLYKDGGYIKARIVSEKISTNLVYSKSAKKRPVKETRELSIAIRLFEGPQYIFDGYRVSGEVIFPEKEIRNGLKMKTNAPFSQSQFMKDIVGVQQLYAGRGYIFAQVVPEDRIDETNHRLSFDVTIDEGEIAHVENIIISGNAKTKEYVVRRELSVAEGDIFDADKIRRSQEKIYNLGFFKDVKLDWKPGSASGLMNLLVDVEEQQTGMITLGATFGADEKGRFVPGGYEEISENNFLGRGYRIHERVDLSTAKQNVEVGFTSPWLFNTPTSFNVDLYYREQERPLVSASNTNLQFHEQASGVSLILGRQFTDYFKAGVGYNLEWTYHSHISNVALGRVKRGRYLRNLFSVFLEYDTRDNVFTPRRGVHLRPGLETSLGMQSFNTYNKYTLDAGFYAPLFWKFVLVLHSYTGVIDRSFLSPRNFNIMTNVGDENRFLLGSADTVRGYAQDGEYPWTQYGLCQQYFNLEARFPIAEQLLWGVFFVDAGSMWKSSRQYTLDPKRYGYSTGLGVRVQIPMLPLRLYWSYRFDYEEGRGLVVRNTKKKGLYSPSFDISVYGLF